MADLQEPERIFKVFGLQSVYICQCQCNNKFNLKLDLRRKTRRKVKLPAYFADLAASGVKDKFSYKDENSYGIRHNCEIKDLSVEGIRIKTLVKHKVQVGDTLLVKFDLGGDGAHRIIEKRAQVHSVKMDLIGCEFFQKDKNDARIGFYLL
ncbi:MAG: PilZ domain-containing protein [Desulfobulbaceae bacterium]|nr:PilZ domain-containing protein [Desulfobulbaceae bacterium]